jgi:signal transduction histidine kinase
MKQVTIDELKAVAAFNDLPDEQLQWIIDHSEYMEYKDGSQLRKTGDEADVMIIILEGGVNFYMDIHGRLVFYYSFTNDETTGGVSGVLPYSRMKTYPGCSFAAGRLRTLLLNRCYFPELEQLNPELIQRLIGYMTERAKAFATLQTQQEKVHALGQLSAGIAHELNNPASAINRISSELTKRLKLNYELTEQLLIHHIDGAHINSIKKLVEAKEAMPRPKLNAIQNMEREDEIIDWLEKAAVPDSHRISETFLEARFAGEDLEEIKNEVSKEAFTQVIYWIENLLSSQRIIKDLAEASERISFLVNAIKSHVQMDRTEALQPTDIHTGIENTLTLLGHKLREKNIAVKKLFGENLPEIAAHVGELNQVWTNIIDNAIYAVGKNGEIMIETSTDGKNVHVKITDNGQGIPPEILQRIFDPFFTTKKVGEGTGIGLDLVTRIVKRHNGEVKVESVPGKTRFSICLPIAQAKSET